MFENIKNNIDFFIRQNTKFSRKNFVEKNEETLLINYLENLYVFDLLDRFFSKTKKDFISVLDIGSKNWSYARGEHSFFDSFCNNFSLTGVEIDAYRLYYNFYTRYEVSKFYIKNLKNTQYIAGNLLELKTSYDYIIWILPFVLESPLKLWGLPKRFFMPEKLLAHAYSIMKDEGQMLIVNQGEKERIAQKCMLEKSNIPYEDLGLINSEFLEYKNERYGFIIRK